MKGDNASNKQKDNDNDSDETQQCFMITAMQSLNESTVNCWVTNKKKTKWR
jgi:hypothetical protein